MKYEYNYKRKRSQLKLELHIISWLCIVINIELNTNKIYTVIAVCKVMRRLINEASSKWHLYIDKIYLI
jgi:hypothetical protein